MASPDQPTQDRHDAALDRFHPVVRRWFAERVGTPTEIQRKAWPEIASGRHVLVTAPTGTGKTLTAFLWALDRLLTGAIPSGGVRVLYVSPLKALNADVHRNLEVPLAELRERFEAAAVEGVQPVRAAVRSGDTPQNERQKMIRRPPEILITTPESLNLLLTSGGGRSILEGLETVILDEIHAVAGTKRGTHLITAVERLTLLSGEIQRVALSATVHPLETVAELVGGFEVEEDGAGWHYHRRPVVTVASEAEKVYDLDVRFPGPADGAPAETGESSLDEPETSVWDLVVPELERIIRGNRSTLVFANSRRLTEKLTRMVNADRETDLAYSHHGSLSREVRQVVEERLKRGELPAIVSTSSLELGIDIGALDRVVMVESPRSIASAIQRIGRAGHRVGEVSRGTLLPIYGRDFLDAAVVTRAVEERALEPLRPIRAPLDVLAQVILSMVVAETWDLDELYAFLRGAWPYRHLPRRHFDLVLEMLAGRYADSRVRELAPRVSIDKVEGTVRARPGAARLIYLSGGTIPDRGYFHLRVDRGTGGSSAEGAGTAPKIGELDEEFVWERSVGDTFTLGTQIWRIRRITHNDVFVEPASGSAAMAPFWRADERDRDFFFSERVGRFLEAIEPRLEAEDLADRLRSEHAMDAGAAAELVRFLRSQKAALGGRLPHRHRLVVERVTGGEELEARRPERSGRCRIVLHTFWGGRVNRPLAVALAAAWEERFGAPLEILHDDDCLMVTVPEELDGEDLLSLVPAERIEELLRTRLEATGFFGALFRQNAARALLLPRAGFRHRMPLWVTRERAKRMLHAVGRYGDFPLVLETWRTCLEDELDLESLKTVLGQVRTGEIEQVAVRTEAPSPFAANLVWKQTNTLMYADDRPEGRRDGALRRDLLRELVFSSHLRPRVPAAVAEELRTKLQRVAPGYAPRDAAELLDWIKERGAIPEDEWRELATAIGRDREARGGGPSGSDDAADPSGLPGMLATIADRAVWTSLPGAGCRIAVSVEVLPRLAAATVGPDGWRTLALGALDAPAADAPAPARENLERMARDAGPEPGDQESEEDGGIGDGATDRLAEVVGSWLRFQAAVPRGRLEAVFGRPPAAGVTLDAALELLVEEERLVVDELTIGTGVSGPEICDTANLETLLRWTRAAARPELRAEPVERLPLFLAVHQGLAPRGRDLEGLQRRLEALFARPARARAWETEILPARLDPYRKAWLDGLLRETDLLWTGVAPASRTGSTSGGTSGRGEGRITFLFPADLELLADEREADPEPPSGADAPGGADGPGADVDDLFPDRRGRFAVEDLAEHAGSSVADVTERLWRLAWQGRVTTDGFEPVRRGILGRFRPADGERGPSRRSRPAGAGRSGRFRSRAADRWRPRRSTPGHWTALPEPAVGTLDALEVDELAKERARLVLDRFGVVFRELLDKELPPLRWSRLFRALRLMELSGEVLAGQFFEGVPGLQFATPEAFRTLRDRLLPDDAVYWMNARDPASPCGLDLPELKEHFAGGLPERREGNAVVFHGDRLVLVARRRGKGLEIRVPPDHPRLDDYLDLFKVQLVRDFAPRKAVEIREINGAPAHESPYLPVLRRLFSTTVEPGSVKLRRRY